MAVSKWLRKGHIGADRRSDFLAICTGETVIDVLGPVRNMRCRPAFLMSGRRA